MKKNMKSGLGMEDGGCERWGMGECGKTFYFYFTAKSYPIVLSVHSVHKCNSCGESFCQNDLDSHMVVGVLYPDNISGHIRTGINLFQCTLMVNL